MITRPQPPPAATAGDDPPAAARRDDDTERALVRSREIRKQANRQIQGVRELAATVRRRRGDPSARSGPAAQEPAARLLDVRAEIERSRQARARLIELAAKLVQTEGTVAHIHDEMADRDSGVPPSTARPPAMPARRRGAPGEIQRNAARQAPP
jgi:hypothetical protein